MQVKNLILLGALSVLLIVLVVLFFTLGGPKKPKVAPVSVPPQQEGASAERVEPVTIVLFFASEADGKLHREEREIIPEPSEAARAKQVIQELLKGSQEGLLSPIPAETELREVYLSKDGTAYVDFSRDFTENHLSGSSAEISTIYSVVNSLSFNLKSIKKVFILIDGGERKTLGGHIDLTRSFSPQYDLVAR
ncbi:MAG: GerMN domain-containing protein [Candidatus Aminicenantales bacterium]